MREFCSSQLKCAGAVCVSCECKFEWIIEQYITKCGISENQVSVSGKSSRTESDYVDHVCRNFGRESFQKHPHSLVGGSAGVPAGVQRLRGERLQDDA